MNHLPNRNISSIHIHLRPHDFGDGGVMELRISVDVGDKRHTSTEVVIEDDLTSRFDYYFDVAKARLRDAIAKAEGRS